MLEDSLDVVNGYIETDIPLTVEVEYYYLQSKLEYMINLTQAAPQQ